ncbi:hypothetical protein PROFUN_15362 [Planoprotostelium fungivorum]|uniref:F-box domain-containing protein n=1 Tax=Planoprotostelium fungivorum TaxID=1890364 RepID=A0A2P6MW38_9EUKA|nr:hypothetical protein PROFUN_15362 [Planoprotostelium fungivorum]
MVQSPTVGSCAVGCVGLCGNRRVSPRLRETPAASLTGMALCGPLPCSPSIRGPVLGSLSPLAPLKEYRQSVTKRMFGTGNVGSPSQPRKAGKSVPKNVVTLLPRVDSTDSIGSHSGDERLSEEETSDEEPREPLVPADDLLPLELMLHVFSYLDLDSLSRASRVCSNWNRISNDNEMWRDRWALRYGESDKRYDVGWKRLYRRSTLWSWSSVHCPPEMEVDNDRRTVRDACVQQSKPKAWTTCIGYPTDSSGKCYYEIKIDRLATNSINIVFGAVREPPILKSNSPFGISTRDKSSWCYCGDGVIMIRGLPETTRAQPFEVNDRIGMKINYRTKSITFFRNGLMQGRRLTGITPDLYPAVSLIDGNQVSIVYPIAIPSNKTKTKAIQIQLPKDRDFSLSRQGSQNRVMSDEEVNTASNNSAGSSPSSSSPMQFWRHLTAGP